MTSGRGELIRAEADLLRATGASDRAELGVLVDEEADFDAWLEFSRTGVEVRGGRLGTTLAYPFPLEDLWDVIADLEDELGDDREDVRSAPKDNA